VNNTLAEEGIPLIMMREERYAVAVADAFSRVTNGKQVGVCTVMGSLNPAGLQMAYGALAQAYEDGSPVLCITDGLPAGASSFPLYDISFGFRSVTKWIGHIDQPQRVPEFLRREIGGHITCFEMSKRIKYYVPGIPILEGRIQ